MQTDRGIFTDTHGEILSRVFSCPTPPLPEFSFSVGGDASTAHLSILWSIVVVLSSPAALLVVRECKESLCYGNSLHRDWCTGRIRAAKFSKIKN